MKRSLLCLALALLMLLCSLPTAALAAEADLADSGVLPLSEIVLTGVTAPTVGAKPNSSCTVDTSYSSYYKISSADWWCVTDRSYMKSTDTFKDWKIYALMLTLSIKNDNYNFTNTLNSVKGRLYNSTGSLISYDKLAVYNTDTTGLHKMLRVYFIFKMPAVDTPLIVYKSTDGSLTGTGAYRPDMTLSTYRYYLDKCNFTPPEGKRFVKWNLGYPGDAVWINSDTDLVPVWESKTLYISKVALKIKEPKVGELINPNWDASDDHYADYTAVNDYYGVNEGGYWYNETKKRRTTADERFEENTSYSLRVTFAAPGSLSFESASKITASLVSLTNSDYSAEVTDGPNAQIRYVSYKFLRPLTEIASAKFGITEPVAGRKPDPDATAKTAGYSANVIWYDGGTISSPGSAMSASSSSFVAGKTYIAELRINADRGYYFPDLFNKIYANNIQCYKLNELHKRDVYIVARMAFTAKSPTVINRVAVSNLAVPVAGAKASYSATTPANSGYSLEHTYNENRYQNGICWLEDGVSMEPGSEFKAGRQYTVRISLITLDNEHEFSTSGLTGTINGVACEAAPYFDSTAKRNIYVRYSFDRLPDAGAYTVGDVNLDNSVTNKDALILDRKLAKWAGYDDKIKVKTVADLNRDESITNKDSLILNRYLAKWTGYEAYIIKVTA